MKNTILALSLFIACSASTFAQSPQATTTDDIAAITKALKYYIEGGTNRDSATFAKAFVTDGQMLFMRNDMLRIVSLKEFVAGMKPGENAKRICYQMIV